MPSMVHHILLCLSLLCYALAAPIIPKRNDAIHARHNGAILTRDLPQSGPATSAAFRQGNVLIPRPPRDVRRQAPSQGTSPFDQTAPSQSAPPFNQTAPPTSMSSSAPSALPTSSQSVRFANTSAVSLSASFPQAANFDQPTSSPASTAGFSQPAGSPQSTAFPQPTVFTLSTSLILSTSFDQPTGFPQSTSYPNSTSYLPSTSLPQSSPATNSSSIALSTSFLQSTSTTFLQPTTLSTSPTSSPQASVAPGAPGTLQLSLVNNLPSSNAHAYISAIETSSGRVVMLTPTGSFYYLPDTGSPVPQAISADIAIPLPAQGQTFQITIPGYIEGARVWFADGTLDFAVVSSVNGPALVEPTAVRREDGSAYTNWGFVELTFAEGYGLFANISFVDFLGLPLALQLQTAASGTQTVPGVPADAVQQVCDRLQQYQGKGAKHWADLCVYGSGNNLIRVISPAVLLSQQPGAFPSFFQQYVDQVWAQYATTPLTINTQNSNGNVACRVNGEELQCDGDNRGYAKPSAMDIFGCDSGPFSIQESDNDIHKAVVPRLCAAFNRGTFLLEGGDVQPGLPPSAYYTAPGPQNLYSAVIHEVELEGRGYAFSYDDVTPSVEEGVAGIVSAGDPVLLTVFVGGM